MCGRYSIVNKDGVTRWIAGFTEHVVQRLLFTESRYNVAPSQLVPVLTNDGRADAFRWGLIPSWAKDEKVGYSTINARAETLAEKPSFRNALTRRRCLIPADGFYEWRKEADGKTKTPVYAQVDGDGVFAFAGLWEVWKNPDGEWVPSCTIITTAPNTIMAPIHDRMPVVLPPEAYAAWLEPREVPAATVTPLLKAFPAERMTVRAVPRLVNSPKNDGPELLMQEW